ncbi:hypothetical protein AVEN_266220-1 [Araneus ventricosus]|uniref:Uncharacterized protein n=1 Tax=Araneus ventricosus TaxID=182803 RepID=A0A4Y2W002_ARAVE|nr:hypothetical protein AVEN_266220-1 [Araneus ventricosus]
MIKTGSEIICPGRHLPSPHHCVLDLPESKVVTSESSEFQGMFSPYHLPALPPTSFTPRYIPGDRLLKCEIMVMVASWHSFGLVAGGLRGQTRFQERSTLYAGLVHVKSVERSYVLKQVWSGSLSADSGVILIISLRLKITRSAPKYP